MTIILEVQVTLLDKLCRPSREAAASLERFGATAQRLVTRVAGMTRDVIGLAGAERELRAAYTALERASGASGRHRGALTGSAAPATAPSRAESPCHMAHG